MDRFGVPFAVNTELPRIDPIQEQSNKVEDTLDLLSQLIPVSALDKEEVLAFVKSDPSHILVKKT